MQYFCQGSAELPAGSLVFFAVVIRCPGNYQKRGQSHSSVHSAQWHSEAVAGYCSTKPFPPFHLPLMMKLASAAKMELMCSRAAVVFICLPQTSQPGPARFHWTQARTLERLHIINIPFWRSSVIETKVFVYVCCSAQLSDAALGSAASSFMNGSSKSKISQRSMHETTSDKKHKIVWSLVHLAVTTKMQFERCYNI